MEKSRSFPGEYRPSYSGRFGQDLGESNSHYSSYSFNGPSGKGEGGFASSSDPELKRKRRVAAYNVFTVERRIKSQVKNSFKWIKTKLTDARYGV